MEKSVSQTILWLYKELPPHIPLRVLKGLACKPVSMSQFLKTIIFYRNRQQQNNNRLSQTNQNTHSPTHDNSPPPLNSIAHHLEHKNARKRQLNIPHVSKFQIAATHFTYRNIAICLENRVYWKRNLQKESRLQVRHTYLCRKA